MTITCIGCDAAWTGMKIEHCPVEGCHQTFSSTPAGDKHRVGDHGTSEGPNRRRCLTVTEMRNLTHGGKGQWREAPWFSARVNEYGTRVWRHAAPAGSVWAPKTRVAV